MTASFRRPTFILALALATLANAGCFRRPRRSRSQRPSTYRFRSKKPTVKVRRVKRPPPEPKIRLAWEDRAPAKGNALSPEDRKLFAERLTGTSAAGATTIGKTGPPSGVKRAPPRRKIVPDPEPPPEAFVSPATPLRRVPAVPATTVSPGTGDPGLTAAVRRRAALGDTGLTGRPPTRVAKLEPTDGPESLRHLIAAPLPRGGPSRGRPGSPPAAPRTMGRRPAVPQTMGRRPAVPLEAWPADGRQRKVWGADHRAPGRPERPQSPARAGTSGASPTTPRPGTHIVRKGETLWSIARHYQIPPAILARANGLSDPDILREGHSMVIPGPDGSLPRPPSPPSSRPVAPRAVSSGRPATTVSRRRPATPPAAPRGAEPESIATLRRGLERTEGALRAIRHRLKKGETLWLLAKKYKVKINEILQWNKLRSLTSIREGIVIEIPVRRGATSVSRRGTARRAVPVGTGRASGRRPRHAVGPRLAWPVRGRLSGRFGYGGNKVSSGIAIDAPAGTPVRAAAAGKVIFASHMRNYGKVVILKHGARYFTVYGNCGRLLVRKVPGGAAVMVRAGQTIAVVGRSGVAGRSQLHFELRILNKAVDPLPYLPPTG